LALVQIQNVCFTKQFYFASYELIFPSNLKSNNIFEILRTSALTWWSLDFSQFNFSLRKNAFYKKFQNFLQNFLLSVTHFKIALAT